MLNQQACEDIIALAHKFSNELANGLEAYQPLPGVADQEIEAIRNRDLVKMEDIVKEKLEVGQNLEAVVNRLIDCIFSLKEICTQSFIETEDFDLQLSNGLKIFQNLHSDILKVDSLKGKIYGHCLETIETRLNDFVSSVEKTNGRLQVNKLLTQDLLKYHQESIRFWQTVAMEAEATYSADGKRKSDQNQGVLKVGA